MRDYWFIEFTVLTVPPYMIGMLKDSLAFQRTFNKWVSPKFNGAVAYRSALLALKHEFPGNVCGLMEIHVLEMLSYKISNIVKAVA